MHGCIPLITIICRVKTKQYFKFLFGQFKTAGVSIYLAVQSFYYIGWDYFHFYYLGLAHNGMQIATR